MSSEASSERPSGTRKLGIWLGLALFAATLVASGFDEQNGPALRMAAVALLMATWWITEALPLAATSLLPLALFPLLGILNGKDTSTQYFNETIVLYIGGFLLALAMERWNLHRRIALTIVGAIGGTPARLVLGFLVATAFISMWISNTATAIMMVAIGLAVVKQLDAQFGPKTARPLTIAILLAIAYGASIGGLATLVGTPPNLSLQRIYHQTFPEAPEIGFGQWMLFGVPVSLLMVAVAWLFLTRILFPCPAEIRLPQGLVADQRRALGGMTSSERIVLGVFLFTAFLWVFRSDLVLGAFTIPGWSRLLPFAAGADGKSLFDDGTVVMCTVLPLFFLRSRVPLPGTPRGETGTASAAAPRLLDGAALLRLPWDIVLLFGGGFALAKGFQVSGLSTWIGSAFAGLGSVSPWLILLLVAFVITFLSELTSNTATAEMALPILASAAVAGGLHPLALMVPATIAASFGFMLPVATPPNAIVFSSGHIGIRDMVRAGFWLNISGILILTLLFQLWGTRVFNIDSGTPLPESVRQIAPAKP